MKLGILVDNLGRRDMVMELIASLHKTVENLPELELILFFQDMYMPMGPIPYAVMQANEAWGFDGVLLGTSLTHALKLNKLPGPKKTAFYIWEAEWAVEQGMPLAFDLLNNTYNDKSIQLIARSNYIKTLVESCFDRKDVPVVENFNIEELVKVLE